MNYCGVRNGVLDPLGAVRGARHYEAHFKGRHFHLELFDGVYASGDNLRFCLKLAIWDNLREDLLELVEKLAQIVPVPLAMSPMQLLFPALSCGPVLC